MKNMAHASRAQKTLDLVIYRKRYSIFGVPALKILDIWPSVPLDIRCLGTTPVQISGVVPQPWKPSSKPSFYTSIQASRQNVKVSQNLTDWHSNRPLVLEWKKQSRSLMTARCEVTSWSRPVTRSKRCSPTKPRWTNSRPPSLLLTPSKRPKRGAS